MPTKKVLVGLTEEPVTHNFHPLNNLDLDTSQGKRIGRLSDGVAERLHPVATTGIQLPLNKEEQVLGGGPTLETRKRIKSSRRVDKLSHRAVRANFCV